VFRAPDVDHEVRWCILKVAEILIRPVEETPPTVKIHIPSTPVIEAAPPSTRAPVKVPRPVKSGGPPAKSPLVPFHPPTKLRLPASPMLDTPRTPTTPLESSKKVAFAQPAPPTKGKFKGKPSKSTNNAKPAHMPKAQSGGMTLNDLRASRSALKKLKSHKHAGVFNQPVDPIRDHAPKYVHPTHCQKLCLIYSISYFDVIKDPVDLSTMSAKLEEGMYKDRFAFQTDFNLMISNAKRYNTPGSFVHNEAIALEIFFEKRMILPFPFGLCLIRLLQNGPS
jgi:transcription initiation factor TFIID subunit 2